MPRRAPKRWPDRTRGAYRRLADHYAIACAGRRFPLSEFTTTTGISTLNWSQERTGY